MNDRTSNGSSSSNRNDDRARNLIAEATKLRYSRRGVLKRATALGLSAPALAGVLSATGHAAAAPRSKAATFIQERSINVLAGTYFVPSAQEFFDQQTQEWGTQAGVSVSTDYINWPDIQARIAASVEGGSGPDVIEMRETWPYLYYENMVPVDDIAVPLGEALGGYYPWVTQTSQVDGTWYSVPVGASSTAFAYRISHLEQAGLADPKNNFPQTWEELFTLGASLKEMGKPLGQALGHSTGDPPAFAYAYMWAYGAMEVEEDGTTVAFNQPQFVEGMERFLQAWTEAYDETGLSWDDSANNRAFLSDQISSTINGSSIYLAAQEAAAGASEADYEVVVDPADIWHSVLPAGPAGQFNQLGSWSYAAMNYSDNQDAAKEFIAWWTSQEHFQPWLEAQQGYIIPMAPGYAELPVFTEDPALAPYPRVSEFARARGFAGPSNQKAAEASSRYIVVDTFAQAVQSGDAAGSIERGAQQLERIYGR